MKILLVHNYYRHRGGEDAVFEREIKLLRKSGHEVITWIKHSNDHLGLFRQVEVMANIAYSSASKKELRELLAREQPDIVHCHNLFPIITPSIYDACEDARVPVVQTLHNFRMQCASALLLRNGQPCELCWNASSEPALKYRCYQGSFLKTAVVTHMIEHHKRSRTWEKKVGGFIALSRFSASKFAETGLATDKIFVKPNFIDAKPHLPLPGKKNTYALFVGRLSEEKGVAVLKDAWQRLEIPLKVAGDGPLLPLLQSLRNVECLGAQPASRVLEMMREASFLVFPTICYENFPLVLAEAFSQGLPVIASDIGSVKEIVSPDVGVLFEAGAPGSLARAADKMWNDISLRNRFSANAVKKFESEYSPDKNLKILESIYRLILKNDN